MHLGIFSYNVDYGARPDELARAAEERGAVRKSTPAGEYFLLPEGHHHGHGDDQSGAVAFAGPMPGAAYMVSHMSSTRVRISLVIFCTVAAGIAGMSPLARFG